MLYSRELRTYSSFVPFYQYLPISSIPQALVTIFLWVQLLLRSHMLWYHVFLSLCLANCRIMPLLLYHIDFGECLLMFLNAVITMVHKKVCLSFYEHLWTSVSYYFPWIEFLRLTWCLELSPETLYLALNWFLPKHKCTFKILLIVLVSSAHLSLVFNGFSCLRESSYLLFSPQRIIIIIEFPVYSETTQIPPTQTSRPLLYSNDKPEKVEFKELKWGGGMKT